MDDPLEAHAPPPAQPDEAPRQLPSLPTEILQRIIQLALPRLSYKTFRERYDILLNCCRVNKLWAALAQAELYRHVWLSHEVAGQTFLAGSTSALVQGTKSLRLMEAEHHSLLPGLATRQLQKITRALPTLKELRLAFKPGSPSYILDVDLGLLSRRCRGLETLSLNFCAISPVPATSPLQLASLRRLALAFLFGEWALTPLLATAQLPHLESLVLIHGEALNERDANKLAAGLLRHAPRLRSFTLSFEAGNDMGHYQLPNSFWSALRSLETLVLDHDYYLSTVLPLIPAPLRRLRIRPPLQHRPALTFQPLEDALEASPPCLQSLKQIVLPPADLSPRTPYYNRTLIQIDEGRARVMGVCTRLGVEVVTVPRFAYGDGCAHLEDALEIE